MSHIDIQPLKPHEREHWDYQSMDVNGGQVT